MKKFKGKFLVFAVLLMLVFAFIGCEDGSNTGESTTSEVWKEGDIELTIYSDDTFLLKENGNNIIKGTLKFNDDGTTYNRKTTAIHSDFCKGKFTQIVVGEGLENMNWVINENGWYSSANDFKTKLIESMIGKGNITTELQSQTWYSYNVGTMVNNLFLEKNGFYWKSGSTLKFEPYVGNIENYTK